MTSSDFVQQVFDDFNEVVVDFVGRADRTTLRATLFDVPRRTEVTLPCYTVILPDFWRTVADVIAPEELGARMRRLACRPNPLHVDGAHWQILIERERRILNGLPAYPRADLEFVFEYAARVLAACRSDGNPFPCDRVGWDMRIVDDDVTADLARHAREWEPDDLVALRRLVASLELYAFMLHGEHRDGIFDHGPYPLRDGEIAMFKDLTDLRSEFLPWSTPDVRLPRAAVSVLFVMHPAVEPRLNWVGTAAFDGGERWEHVRRAAVFSVDAGVPTPLKRADWDGLAEAALAAQRRLFVRIAKWPEDQKVKYGRWLFANHVHAIATFLELPPAVMAGIVDRFGDCVDRQYREIEGAGPSPVWAALRRPQPFTPLAEAA